ncbi:Gfo/Idh/MocA family protein [Microbacterium esteraromaticum]|uniref:Gfo/Idh/MocA family protein n=1 Tax=Microbacterium esteraromaticum TaxID=57043 RepID=UPI002174E980|nr:Gfo/Idh/MocA family oxidoreductase [Microbacterium esteraromaticum]
MENTLRVGIVGAGGIAPPHIEGWLALGAQVSILRRTDAEALADRYGIRIVGGLDELIGAVDVVDIISPTSTHLGIARAAFARGRHVVCEKPLAVSTADARSLIDAADEAGVRLFPAHVVRYFEGYRDLHARIGTVGRLTELTFRRTVAAPDSAWFYAEDAGGGVIRDLMIHDIDQALWLAGSVVEVSATQDPPRSAAGCRRRSRRTSRSRTRTVRSATCAPTGSSRARRSGRRSRSPVPMASCVTTPTSTRSGQSRTVRSLPTSPTRSAPAATRA